MCVSHIHDATLYLFKISVLAFWVLPWLHNHHSVLTFHFGSCQLLFYYSAKAQNSSMCAFTFPRVLKERSEYYASGWAITLFSISLIGFTTSRLCMGRPQHPPSGVRAGEVQRDVASSKWTAANCSHDGETRVLYCAFFHAARPAQPGNEVFSVTRVYEGAADTEALVRVFSCLLSCHQVNPSDSRCSAMSNACLQSLLISFWTVLSL